MASSRKTPTLCERDTRQLWWTILIHPLGHTPYCQILSHVRILIITGYYTLLYSYNFNPIKNNFTSHIDKKIFLTFLLTPYLYTFSLYENPSFIIFSAETEYISLEIPVPSQGHYGFYSFPVVDWFCVFIYLWVFSV
jgi:hypothetical protein